MIQRALPFLGLFIWSVLILFTPATVHLRDSGEFLLTAFALDIPHPAGFPTYAQLANLFALIPFGPIGWRINAFSTAMIFLSIGLSWYLSFRLLDEWLLLRRELALLVSSITPVILIGSNAVIHQAYAAEVYGLNTVILLSLVLCYERWSLWDDKRYLYLAAFIAGLGLGNHVSLGASLFLMLLLVVLDRRKIGAAIPIAAIFGLVGLAVYAYLPIRAELPRPLMVATPDTVERFIAHVTDERDRVLRPEALPFGSDSSKLGLAISDLARIGGEVGFLALIIAAVGGYWLFRVERRIAWTLGTVLFGNWLFFMGWDPDPWVPTFAVIAILASFSVGCVVELIASKRERSRLPLGLALLSLLLSLSSFSGSSITELSAIRDDSFVRDQAKSLVAHRVSSESLVVEPSWFIVRYLQQIERYRDDLNVVYLPSILFPQFFSPVTVTLNESPLFTSTDAAKLSPDQQMSRFISAVSQHSTIVLEPVASIYTLVGEVVRFTASGDVKLVRSKQREIEPGYADAIISRVALMHKAAQATAFPLRADSQQYVETIAATVSGFLSRIGERSLAGDLLLAACGSLEQADCSGTMLNNLSAHYINLGEYQRAIDAAEVGLTRPAAPRRALKENLAAARSGLLKEAGNRS